MDLAIRFGNGAWPGLHSEMLVAAPFVVIAAPGLARGREMGVEEMARYPWVVDTEWTEQRRWLSNQGVDVDSLRITSFPTEELAMTACRTGYGLSVQAYPLVIDDVEQRRLSIVHRGDPGRDGYYIATLPGRDGPHLRTFIRWLKSVA